MKPIHGDMRDPTEGKPAVLLVVSPPPDRPSCEACTRGLALGVAGKVRVERALIVRASTGGYIAIVHCHGATDVIELPANAVEADVNAAVAFKRGRQ